jgi:hypothetical protein
VEQDEFKNFFESLNHPFMEQISKVFDDHDTENRNWLTYDQFETMLRFGSEEMRIKTVISSLIACEYKNLLFRRNFM